MPNFAYVDVCGIGKEKKFEDTHLLGQQGRRGILTPIMRRSSRVWRGGDSQHGVAKSAECVRTKKRETEEMLGGGPKVKR